MVPSAWSRPFRAYLSLVLFSVFGTILSKTTGLDPGLIAPIASILTLALGVGCVLAPLGGKARVALWVLAIGAASEIVGLYTGWPFGNYRYTGAWQPSLALPGGQLFPVALPFAWLMMAAGSYLAALKLGCGKWALVAGPAIATVADIAMEPAATGPLGYWVWLGGDAIPGWLGAAPLMNSLGWFVTALLGSLALWAGGVRDSKSPEPGLVVVAHVLLMGFLAVIG